MFHPEGPSFWELVVQALSATERGYELLAPKFEYTPLPQHILTGVSLGVVQELAAKLSVPFVNRLITVEDLRSADEAMLASTSVCLLPVVECDGWPIGTGQPGPNYRRLLAAWSELVGTDIAEQARRVAARRA
jgi:hypothetical protein